MAPSIRNYHVAITVAFIFLLTINLFPKSVDSVRLPSSESRDLQQTKLVMGSGPPSCYMKCQGCTPCTATLVTVPAHHPRGEEDEPYYPQTWRCKCGDRLFDPRG
ncbi:hypothetical protein M0R45_031565 [Rubus argutus]|uniref:Epidermal patterning factor-like protein n=1 Tax=Rubus argutus TaxID=59490 RepID=A0AAW1WII0_RUBAR